MLSISLLIHDAVIVDGQKQVVDLKHNTAYGGTGATLSAVNPIAAGPVYEDV